MKLKSEIANKSQNNVPVSQQELKSLVIASLGSGWIKLHPESVEHSSKYYNTTNEA